MFLDHIVNAINILIILQFLIRGVSSQNNQESKQINQIFLYPIRLIL